MGMMFRAGAQPQWSEQDDPVSPTAAWVSGESSVRQNQREVGRREAGARPRGPGVCTGRCALYKHAPPHLLASSREDRAGAHGQEAGFIRTGASCPMGCSGPSPGG